MMMRIFYVLFIGFYFTNLCYCYDVYEEERISDKLINSVAKRLEKDKKLAFLGIGGRMMYDVETFFLHFDCSGKLNLEKARKLILECVEFFIDEVNSDLKLRPYLRNFPCTSKNVEMMIGHSGMNLSSEYISFISLSHGEINYNVNNLETKQFDTVHEETYEEAITTLKKEEEQKTKEKK